MSQLRYAVGLDLGGSSVKAVAVDLSGQLLQKTNREFDPQIPKQWAETSRSIVHDFALAQGQPAERMGISAPGLAARDGLSIAFMPGRLQGLQGFNWTQYLESPRPVPVLNDAHAALMGEVWVGAARDEKNVILLTLGTGVGGAAMVDGHLLKGAIGRAGHLGHNCLDMGGTIDVTGIPGSIEVLIGNCTIQLRTSGRFENTHDLISACKAGDASAEAIWMKSVHALACSIASYINLFDPACVIVGGGIARAGDSLFVPLERRVREIEWQPGGHKVPIIPAKLGELAGAFGAAWNALRESV